MSEGLGSEQAPKSQPDTPMCSNEAMCSSPFAFGSICTIGACPSGMCPETPPTGACTPKKQILLTALPGIGPWASCSSRSTADEACARGMSESVSCDTDVYMWDAEGGGLAEGLRGDYPVGPRAPWPRSVSDEESDVSETVCMDLEPSDCGAPGCSSHHPGWFGFPGDTLRATAGPHGAAGGADIEALPQDVITLVAGHLDAGTMANVTAVNRPWLRVFGTSVTRLSPMCISALLLPRRFPELQILDLGNCAGSSLTDNAIAQFAFLPCLRAVRIRAGHQITDEGLAAVSGCHRLRELDIGGGPGLIGGGLRYLEGLTGLRSLTCDKWAKLSDCQLAALSSLKGLRHLSLAACPRLSGQGLCFLSPLSSLEVLDLSGLPGLAEENLASLAPLSSLTMLSMDRCSRISGRGLARLWGLPGLQHLSLRQCMDVSDEGLHAVASLSHLRHLVLDYCENITDAGVAALAGLKGLTNLSLRGCRRLKGPGLGPLSGLPHLATLNLAGCRCLGYAAGELVGSLPSLRELNLHECERVDDVFLLQVSRASQLTRLTASGCRYIKCGGLTTLAGSCRSLRWLDLNGCSSVRDAGLAALATLPDLETLNLSNCSGIGDAGVAPLTRLTALTSLNLAQTKVGTEALAALSCMQGLELSVWGFGALSPSSPLRFGHLSRRAISVA
eukprot:jgi/Botrbrau1/19926/Bobra.0059s0043.1